MKRKVVRLTMLFSLLQIAGRGAGRGRGGGDAGGRGGLLAAVSKHCLCEMFQKLHWLIHSFVVPIRLLHVVVEVNL